MAIVSGPFPPHTYAGARVFNGVCACFHLTRWPVLHFVAIAARFKAPLPLGAQVCCKVAKAPQRPACLPSLVVVGAQKGGTTALLSYLLFHPRIVPPKKKEVHFFDVLKNFKKGAKHYLTYFSLDMPHKRAVDDIVQAEATPSYLVAPHTCANMRQVIPYARLIYVVRDPVDRFWSEWNMKARRLVDQAHFKDTVHTKARALLICFERAGHGGAAARRRLVREGARPAQSPAVNPLTGPKNTQSALSDRPGGGGARNALAKSTAAALERFSGCVKKMAPSLVVQSRWRILRLKVARYRIRTGDWRQCFRASSQRRDAEGWRNVEQLVGSAKSAGSMALTNDALLDAHLIPAADGEAATVDISFDDACFEKPIKVLREKLKPLMGAIRAEAETIDDCLSRPGNTELDPITGNILAVRGTQCVPPNTKLWSDISRNYLFRGMYGWHFTKCLEHGMPRDQILVIDNTDLRNRADETLRRVQEHSGLPVVADLGTKHSVKEVHDKINSVWPKFESTTGWRMDTKYEAIPDEARSYLTDFYRRHNEWFFWATGRRFHWRNFDENVLQNVDGAGKG